MTVEAVHPPICCERCKKPLTSMTKSGRRKVYIKSRTLVIRADGGMEIPCHHCKMSTSLPFFAPKVLTAETSKL